MKHLFLSSIFILSGFYFYAQGTLKDVKDGNLSFGNNPQTMAYYENLRTMMTEKNNATGAGTVKGTPYDNDAFATGTIVEGETIYKNVLLRYNVYKDEVEIKISNPEAKSENIYALRKTPGISFTIDNKTLKYMGFFGKNKKDKISGNLFVLFEGPQYSLYQRKLKLYKESKKATTSLQRSFPARFVDDAEYYIEIANTPPAHFKPTLKKLLSFVDEDKKRSVKSHVKEEKLNLKNPDHLIELFRYMNSL